MTISKESTTIVGDGSTEEAVATRVKQINVLEEQAESDYEKEKMRERVAKLSGGVAIIQVTWGAISRRAVFIFGETAIKTRPQVILTIRATWSSLPFPQVGAHTETELKEKKLRVEDALNATKAAVEEGIVVGGGSTLIKLSAKVDQIKDNLENDEQKLGAEIVKKALLYPMRLIASNAGSNGSVVIEKVRGEGGRGGGIENRAMDLILPRIGSRMKHSITESTNSRFPPLRAPRSRPNRTPTMAITLQAASSATCWPRESLTPPRSSAVAWKTRRPWLGRSLHRMWWLSTVLTRVVRE